MTWVARQLRHLRCMASIPEVMPAPEALYERTLERTLRPVETRVVPKTQLRDRIKDEIARLNDDTVMLVTDRGRPLAVMVSVERWNQLQEDLEDLGDTVAVLEHQLNPGDSISLEEYLAEVEAEEAEEADVQAATQQEG
jgi:prevent-host-death family protein